MSYNPTDLEKRMNGAIDNLQKEFSGLRTGRASPDLLSAVMVDAYGAPTPLNQVANVSAPEARLLSVQVWDGSMVGAVEKGIRDANLGLNPMPEGQVIRVPMPELNEERRKDLVKVAKKYAEETRVAIRNVRRDGMDSVKKEDMPEDESKRAEGDIQKLTDDFVSKVDDMLKNKEADILQV